MKKYLLFIILSVAFFTACQKDKKTVIKEEEKENIDTLTHIDTLTQTKKDELLIKDFIEEKGLSAIRDTSGLYYVVIAPGEGLSATEGTTINVDYAANLLNGTLFDQGTGTKLQYNLLLTCWKIGLSYIKEHGKILIIAPSALGYGKNIVGIVPANSVLVFNVTLNSVR